MLGQSQDNSNNLKQAEKTGEDLTGRDRLVSNVIFVWAAHFVFIIAGFIMPRMIDRRLGQELLGVWDFAWSLVHYFGFVQVGIGSSVNRYVARYRAAGDISGVNRTVSSASCVLGVGGLLALGLTIATSLLLPQLFGARLGDNVLDAQWVVFFLGATIAIEVSFAAFSGVLTGYHRWGLHNIIKSGWHVATVAGMILALLWGGSLSSLAVITFVGLALQYVTRVIIAHRVCNNLRLRASLVTWGTIRKLFFFGGKTLVPGISRLLMNQTTRILIVVYLGPAALALYSRPSSLILHVRTLIKKMAMTLTPTTSSLQSSRNIKEIEKLLIKSVRYSFYIVLPIVMLLMVFGDTVLLFWMGPRYANGLLPAILAAGFLAEIGQIPAYNILIGMNAHGRAGIAYFVASICSVGFTILALGIFRWELAGVAVGVTLPLTVLNVTYLPFLVCRRLGLNTLRYFISVAVKPALYTLPFALCLVCCRFLHYEKHLYGALLAFICGVIVLFALYWHVVLPQRLKQILIRMFTMKCQALGTR